jgi:hypothetical protein
MRLDWIIGRHISHDAYIHVVVAGTRERLAVDLTAYIDIMPVGLAPLFVGIEIYRTVAHDA